MPTEKELKQLESYRERILSVYNKSYAQIILGKALPSCGGHNTTTFRKGSRQDGTADQWFYRKLTWQTGPRYIPDITDPNYQGLGLPALLDKIEDIVPESWQRWKKDHPDLFQ